MITFIICTFYYYLKKNTSITPKKLAVTELYPRTERSLTEKEKTKVLVTAGATLTNYESLK